MLKKLLIYSYFGRPQGWEEKYIANFNTLEKYGWDWLICTDVDVKSKGNVKVLPLNFEQYKDLVEKKFGVRPNWHITAQNQASRLLDNSASGYLFEEYLKGYDFWGWTGLDVVMGRVDKWLTDEYLADCDVFGNDPDALNGCLSLLRNTEENKFLFKAHPDWKRLLSDSGWFAFEENELSQILREMDKAGKIRFKTAFWIEGERNPLHSHAKHGVTLSMSKDGSLFNAYTGKEIMMFHFNYSKKYPNL